MKKENLRAWIQHFQHRIILIDTPKFLYISLLNFLNRAYNDCVCNYDDVCKVVNFLDCELPRKSVDKVPLTVSPPTEIELTDPCKSPLDIKVNIVLGHKPTSLLQKSDYEFTLLRNPEYFTFKSNGKYSFNIIKYIENNPSKLPINLYLSIEFKLTANSIFTIQKPYTYIGYYK